MVAGGTPRAERAGRGPGPPRAHGGQVLGHPGDVPAPLAFRTGRRELVRAGAEPEVGAAPPVGEVVPAGVRGQAVGAGRPSGPVGDLVVSEAARAERGAGVLVAVGEQVLVR